MEDKELFYAILDRYEKACADLIILKGEISSVYGERTNLQNKLSSACRTIEDLEGQMSILKNIKIALDDKVRVLTSRVVDLDDEEYNLVDIFNKLDLVFVEDITDSDNIVNAMIGIANLRKHNRELNDRVFELIKLNELLQFDLDRHPVKFEEEDENA